MWNHVVNKAQYVIYFRIFKIATVCLDESFAHCLHDLSFIK